ncbi:histidine kinase [Isoptericola sp. NPDC019482]|uniref:sensor histidine kinase n=1 Tax=Isoptericola sp. NPDC019482 TaxID=3154688 RepID=UPI003492550F
MKTAGAAAPTLTGGARGVEVYTRISLYLVALVEPFLYLSATATLTSVETGLPSTGSALALAIAALLHTLACLAFVHVGFTRPSERPARSVVGVLAGTTLAVVVLAFVALPPTGGDATVVAPRAATAIVCLAATTGALAVVVGRRRLVAVGVVVAAVAVAVQATAGDGGLVAAALFSFVLTMFWAGSVRLSMWIVEVVRRLADARSVAARLAVAEERLRIARDMHDVVGRALSAVAVKSELAAALARRGDPRGADQMDEVRTLAQESLREVRGVVAGYRAANLATELDGARSVLRAAGVTVRVVGDLPDLAAPQVEALAWVLREGVTNIVRHSDAREARIDLTDTDTGGGRELALTVTNDGVPAAGPTDGRGSGLVGLRERLAAVGGALDAGSRGDRFVLTARVPAPSPENPEPREAAA